MPIDGGGASQHLFRSSAMSHFRPPTDLAAQQVRSDKAHAEIAEEIRLRFNHNRHRPFRSPLGGNGDLRVSVRQERGHTEE
jgi:hypothetical protein